MSVRKKIITSTTPEGEQREKTWWIADYTDGGGGRHQVRFKHKDEAKAHEERSKVAIRSGGYVAVDRNATVADAAQVWLDRVAANGMRHRGPVEFATLRQYKQHVELHIVPRIGAIKLAKLTEDTVGGFRNALLANDGNGKPVMSRALARKVMISFKSILKANKCGHVADDVTIGTDPRSKRELKIGRDMPTPEEIKRVIEAAAMNPRLHALLLVAALCGLRASELRGLCWSDVDFKAGELHVSQRADRRNELGSPKTAQSRRSIPLPSEAVLALKKWNLATAHKDGFVFPTSNGKVEHHKNMLRSLVPVMKEAKLMRGDKPKYGLHALRHFFASWCINPKERGGRQLPAKVAQQWLGHSSIMVTMDIYGHLFPRGSDRTELDGASKALLG